MIEFRSVIFRDRLLLIWLLRVDESIVSLLPLCRLTISPITRRSDCREKAIIMDLDFY